MPAKETTAAATGREKEHRVVIPAASGAALEAIEPRFILLLALTLLDPPPAFGRGDQSLQPQSFQEVAEEALGRVFGGPFDR